ncbi:MAG: hypothetical protein LBQ83_02500 [Candidatus Margulisbacteria bacterium]|jgi:hypothetical protein|nr:hypothetical protein [Candidatus Margulisiibacteriota bacterium]
MHQRSFLKLTALFMLGSFIAVSLLAAVFVLTHFKHEHNRHGAHGSCSVCVYMLAAQSLGHSVPAAGVLLFLGVAFDCVRTLSAAAVWAGADTLISLKVRLNN